MPNYGDMSVPDRACGKRGPSKGALLTSILVEPPGDFLLINTQLQLGARPLRWMAEPFQRFTVGHSRTVKQSQSSFSADTLLKEVRCVNKSRIVCGHRGAITPSVGSFLTQSLTRTRLIV